MGQSPYENLRNKDLIAEVENRDRQLQEMHQELEMLRGQLAQREAPALFFPNGEPVTEEAIRELWASLEKPSSRPVYGKPDAFRLLFGIRTAGHRQITVARVPDRLCSELDKLHSWIKASVSGDGGGINVKDWIVRTIAWRVGIVVMRTAPGIQNLHTRLISESDESIESALLQTTGEHLRHLLGWPD